MKHMKLYAMLLSIIVVNIMIFGVVAPYLISYPSNELVFFGLLSIFSVIAFNLLMLPLLYRQIKNLIKKGD